jgi:hypothetical protein
MVMDTNEIHQRHQNKISNLINLLTNQLHGAEHHSRGHQLLGHLILSQHFMEPEGSPPNSQNLSTCPYPEPDQSSPHHPFLFLQNPFTNELN